LTLILSVIANGVLFFHAHELENGNIITHGHPILTEEQENLPDHGHTESELIILDIIAHADYFIFEYKIPVPERLEFEIFSFCGVVSSILFSQTLIGFDHRGPPALV
jgi:hypothetical protein